MTTSNIPYGWARRKADGKSVHVSEVPAGLECGCACSHCGANLVARKGDVLVHHFAHHRLDDCGCLAEHELYLRSREILAEAREITLTSGWRRFERAFIDARVGDRVVDVLFESPDMRLAVNIHVSGQVNGHRTSDMVPDRRLSYLVIDLSGIDPNIFPGELRYLLTARTDLQYPGGSFLASNALFRGIRKVAPSSAGEGALPLSMPRVTES